MQLTREMIIDHPKMSDYLTVPAYVDSTIDGRQCGRHRLPFLPLIADLMRESFDRLFRYLEVGTLFGASMCAVSCHRRSSKSEKYVGIDLFNYYGEELDPTTGNAPTIERADRNIRYFAMKNFALFEGDSSDVDVAERAFAYLHADIALLYLDGAHDLGGLSKDLEIYLPHVAPGGVVVVDDYHSNDWPDVTQVMDAFESDEWDKIGPISEDGRCTLFVMQKN